MACHYKVTSRTKPINIFFNSLWKYSPASHHINLDNSSSLIRAWCTKQWQSQSETSILCNSYVVICLVFYDCNAKYTVYVNMTSLSN